MSDRPAGDNKQMTRLVHPLGFLLLLQSLETATF
jgi:hypothetical protein